MATTARVIMRAQHRNDTATVSGCFASRRELKDGCIIIQYSDQCPTRSLLQTDSRAYSVNPAGRKLHVVYVNYCSRLNQKETAAFFFHTLPSQV